MFVLNYNHDAEPLVPR